MMRSLDLLGGFEDVGAKAVIQRRNDDVVELAWIVSIRTDCSRQHVGSPRFFGDKQLATVFVVNLNEARMVGRIGRRLGLHGHWLSRAPARGVWSPNLTTAPSMVSV